jgi:hypothetical protein
MGKQQWTDEVIQKFTRQIIVLLKSRGCIRRALNEPVTGLTKDAILKELGFEGGEVPGYVWARVRKCSKGQRIQKELVRLIGDGRGWFLGTMEDSAMSERSRAKEAVTRIKNVAAAIGATDRQELREELRFLDDAGKSAALRLLCDILVAMGEDEDAHAILAALPAPAKPKIGK